MTYYSLSAHTGSLCSHSGSLCLLLTLWLTLLTRHTGSLCLLLTLWLTLLTKHTGSLCLLLTIFTLCLYSGSLCPLLLAHALLTTRPSAYYSPLSVHLTLAVAVRRCIHHSWAQSSRVAGVAVRLWHLVAVLRDNRLGCRLLTSSSQVVLCVPLCATASRQEVTNPLKSDTVRHTATQFNTLQQTTTQFDTLRHSSTNFNTLRHSSTYYDTLQHISTHYDTVRHTATQFDTLRYISTLLPLLRILQPVVCRHCSGRTGEGCWRAGYVEQRDDLVTAPAAGVTTAWCSCCVVQHAIASCCWWCTTDTLHACGTTADTVLFVQGVFRICVPKVPQSALHGHAAIPWPVQEGRALPAKKWRSSTPESRSVWQEGVWRDHVGHIRSVSCQLETAAEIVDRAQCVLACRTVLFCLEQCHGVS